MLRLTAVRLTAPLCTPAPPLHADPDRPYCQAYIVQATDTMDSVAKLFGTTNDKLVELNSGAAGAGGRGAV